MDKKVHFSPASEEGHFDGLVVEGKYLRTMTLGARGEGSGVRDWKENAKIKM